jgi:ABC-type glycerol-3-phosphate transport system permease component
MAAVQSTRQKVLNRAAVAVVVLLTLVYLVPIYWITSTAFKPRSLATTDLRPGRAHHQGLQRQQRTLGLPESFPQ